MGFQDVGFLPSQASFSPTFLASCAGGEFLRTTYLRTVIPTRPFYMSAECHKVEVNLATISFEDIARFKTVLSVRLIGYVRSEVDCMM